MNGIASGLLSLRARSGSPTQAGRGLVGVERQQLLADAKIMDGPVPPPEIDGHVNLVGVEQAKAGRDHDLLVSDLLEALRDDVMAVDADRTAGRAQKAPGLGFGRRSGPQDLADDRRIEDVERARKA